MSLKVFIENVEYTGFTSVIVHRQFSTCSGDFNITASWLDVDEFNKYPLRVQQTIKITIDGVTVINGFIEKIIIKHTSSAHTIIVSGRDKTADFIDGIIQANTTFTAPTSLLQITEKVLNGLGITNIQTIDLVSSDLFTEKDLISGKIGEKAFDFIEQYCRKRQLIISTDGNGNIVFNRASTTRINTVLVHQPNNKLNNIVESTLNLDDSNRYHSYVVHSQVNAAAGYLLPQTGSSTDTGFKNAPIIDTDVRATRPFEMVAENASDAETCKKRATWEANNRRSNAFSYECVVQGFFADDDNMIWEPNLIVSVNDFYANLSGDFLVDEVIYNFSITKGSTTTLKIITSDAYTLQAEKSSFNAQATTQATGYLL